MIACWQAERRASRPAKRNAHARVTGPPSSRSLQLTWVLNPAEHLSTPSLATPPAARFHPAARELLAALALALRPPQRHGRRMAHFTSQQLPLRVTPPPPPRGLRPPSREAPGRRPRSRAPEASSSADANERRRSTERSHAAASASAPTAAARRFLFLDRSERKRGSHFAACLPLCHAQDDSSQWRLSACPPEARAGGRCDCRGPSLAWKSWGSAASITRSGTPMLFSRIRAKARATISCACKQAGSRIIVRRACLCKRPRHPFISDVHARCPSGRAILWDIWRWCVSAHLLQRRRDGPQESLDSVSPCLRQCAATIAAEECSRCYYGLRRRSSRLGRGRGVRHQARIPRRRRVVVRRSSRRRWCVPRRRREGGGRRGGERTRRARPGRHEPHLLRPEDLRLRPRRRRRRRRKGAGSGRGAAANAAATSGGGQSAAGSSGVSSGGSGHRRRRESPEPRR